MPAHPDTVIISDPVGVGEEMRSPGMSGSAGIWSDMRRTDDNKEADKIQSVISSDPTSEHRRGRSDGGNDVGAWSRLLAGSSTVTEEVFFAI